MGVTHLPVMSREVLEYMRPEQGEAYVDATVGPGGHSELLLEAMAKGGRLLCIDRDAQVLELAKKRLGHDSRCSFAHAAFADMAHAASDAGFAKVQGVLMDLGVSMLQLKTDERGFSFMSDANLDMRMDPSTGVTAEDVVNSWPERELADMIYTFGEEHRSRRIASSIVRARAKSRIQTCRQLADVIEKAVGRSGRTHPATRTFQAIRIEVNDEMGQLTRGLEAASGMLYQGGRLVVITYHSLEDRAVKHFMKDRAKEGSMKLLTKKALKPTREEVLTNPSARSAKLRCAEAAA